ncbi:MAG: hypothetical protein J6F30_08450 [Cellulosilyticum sp.]|nr:hypothetical protein [Cellulosilyticum sp.]
MEQKLKQRFKYLALLARGIGVFPFLIVFSYIYSKQYNKDLFGIQLGALIGVVILGYIQINIHAWLERKLRNKLWIERMIIGLLYILEIGLIIYGIWGYLHTDGPMKLATSIVYIILYLMSIKAYEQHYTSILSIELIVIISCFYVIAMGLCKYGILGLMYLLVMATFIFLSNQQKLEQLLSSTKENTPMFRNIRSDNMKWVSLVMGCILILYPCRKHIEGILWWTWQQILKIISFIVYIIVSLLALLKSDDVVSEGAANEAGMGNLPPAEYNEWLDIIFWILVISITTYVCIKKRKAIVRILCNKWNRLKVLIGKVCNLLFGEKEKTAIVNEYYEDVIEDMSYMAITQLQKGKNTTKRRWVKQVKKYLKYSSEPKQYREGYKLLLQGVKICGVEIQIAQTPREIMKYIESVEKIPSIESETKDYEMVRYKELEANEEQLEQLKQTLRQLMNASK